MTVMTSDDPALPDEDLPFVPIHRVNGSSDLGMERENYAFIDHEVMLVKKCKSGLYLVRLPDGREKAIAKKNLDQIPSVVPQSITRSLRR